MTLHALRSFVVLRPALGVDSLELLGLRADGAEELEVFLVLAAAVVVDGLVWLDEVAAEH